MVKKLAMKALAAAGVLIIALIVDLAFFTGRYVNGFTIGLFAFLVTLGAVLLLWPGRGSDEIDMDIEK